MRQDYKLTMFDSLPLLSRDNDVREESLRLPDAFIETVKKGWCEGLFRQSKYHKGLELSSNERGTPEVWRLVLDEGAERKGHGLR